MKGSRRINIEYSSHFGKWQSPPRELYGLFNSGSEQIIAVHIMRRCLLMFYSSNPTEFKMVLKNENVRVNNTRSHLYIIKKYLVLI